MYLQVFVYGIFFVNLALVIATVLMYILIVENQRYKYYMQVETNETLKTDILLSQIQPHFLFNMLTVIREICLEDQSKAAGAIDDFAKYLRHNMNSINMNKPVPFDEELQHTKRYIELQQLRFGGELNIEYDIGCVDFRIPSLTLQPIVENAVRYGIRKKETGEGKVIIRTREYPKSYEIQVIDDGPGFDPSKIDDDDRGHIGLKNVESRLKRMAGGSMIIDSVIGLCTSGEIAAALWEEETDMKKNKDRIRHLVQDLKSTFNEIGMDQAVIRRSGLLGIRRDMFDCDYYRMLSGDASAVNSYYGEYMNQYSWAEMTHGRLESIN